MNLIDRVVAYVSPGRGMQRARARYATRIYEGATQGRRATSWKTLHSAANAELQYAIRPLRDRSRDLVRNTPHAPRMLDIITAHAVGDAGIVPVSRTGSDKLDRRVDDAWRDWSDNCDVTGQLTFAAMQALAIRSTVESGEVVVRFIDERFEPKSGVVPFKLQLLEADYIDQWRDGIYGDPAQMPGVQKSRLGVALGEYDRRMGLWLWPYHPGEITTINMRPLISQLVPQDEVVHMFKPLRPGQVRGVPWFAPILMTAREFEDFRDAVNVKARVEACFSAFITNDDTSAPLLDSSTTVDPTWDNANPTALVTTIEPGMMKELRQGQDVKFAQPTANTQIDPMILYNLMAMAAGVGVTYDQLSGDLRRANYSSLRAGKLDFWKLTAQLQKQMIIPQLCKKVRDRWLSRAVLAGALPDRGRGGYPCDWVVPVRDAVDPQKDFEAEKNEVRAGRITPQQFIAGRGNDWRKNLEAFKEFFAAADTDDLVFDIDPRSVDQSGKQAATPEDPAAAGDGKTPGADTGEEDGEGEDGEK